MSASVLITGGAGFIGTLLSRRLVEAGYDVAVMDVLLPQVHGERPSLKLAPSVRLFTGDVTHAPTGMLCCDCSVPRRSSIWRLRRERRSRCPRRLAMARSTLWVPPSFLTL